MRSKGLPHVLAAAALSLGLAQCATGRAVVGVQEGERCVVVFQSAGQSLSMINQTAITAEEGDAARRQDPGLKIVPDAEVQALLNAMAADGFFEVARPVAYEGSKSWLVVKADDRTWIASNRAATPEPVACFARCVSLFQQVYNANHGYSGSRLKRTDLEQEGRSVNQASEAIRREKSGKQRP